MSYFHCRTIEFLPIQFAEISPEGAIVPKPDYEWTPLNSADRASLSEEGEVADGNIYYKQELNADIKYTAEIVNSLHDGLLIMKLTNLDGSVFVWGSLAPMNPVETNISIGMGIISSKFSRNSILPQV